MNQAASRDDSSLTWSSANEKTFGVALSDCYRTLWRRRALIRFFVACQQRSGLSKTILRELWLVIDPLAQMLIYYFLVVIVFKARNPDGPHPFLFIMTGIVHYLFLNQAVAASGQSLISQRSLLIQLKLEPVVIIMAQFYRSVSEFLIAGVLYIIAYLLLGPPPTWRLALYPLVLFELFLIAWLLSVIVASLAVYFRDLDQLTKIVMRVMMYLAPVIYMVTFVPEHLRDLYLLNPIACVFNLFQWCLLNAPPPPPHAMASLAAFTLVLFLAAHAIYFRARPGFTKAF